MFKFDFKGDDLIDDESSTSDPHVQDSGAAEEAGESPRGSGAYREFTFDELVSPLTPQMR